MAKSLYSTVLHSYTYEQIRDLCFTEGSTFGNALDCEWGVWRDKAVADFNISPQFFDLVGSFASNGIRTLSGPQRYLQIATYVKLSPLSGVRVYKDTGVIEGVYEASAGYSEAAERRDWEMLLWFANRAKPEQQTGSVNNALQRAQKTIDFWSKKQLGKEKTPFFQYDDLRWFVKHGKVKELDQIIHDYFNLPEGFSIERDIPFVPFWEITDIHSALFGLPIQDYPEEEIQDLVRAVLSSGDTRIVDFFRSIFRDRLDNLVSENRSSARKSLILHDKPEQTYGIELRFLNPEDIDKDYSYMAEFVLNLVLPDDDPDTRHWLLTRGQGNITYLTAVLPLFSKESVKRAFNFVDGLVYPLSKAILKSYL
jgi:hypothetical protein